MKMPLEGTIEQARLNLLMEQDVNKVDLTDDSNFLVAKDLNVETIEVLTSLIEDEDEQVDVASKLYDMVLDEVGSVPDSPETDDDIVITDDDIVITDATPLRAKGTWNIVLQQLVNEPKVTYQLIEECIARNVSIEERIDAYRYVMIKLRTSKKRIYDQDVEEGVKVASSTMDMQHIQMLVHDINTRMRNAVFAKYESEYESTYLYHALLSAGEERDLCVARNMLKEQLLLTNNQRDVVLINQIDEEIRAMLINYNYRLVMRNAIMQSVHIHHLELMDLFQEGCIGLIKAIDKFDIAKEVRISTYATWWIRQSIGRAIDDRDRSIRLPVHFLLVIRRYNKFMYLFENANPGMVPSDEFVAKELNILIKDIPKIKYWNQRIISLNTPVGDDSTTSISDYIEDDSDIITAVVRTLLAESIWRALQDCTDRQRFILIRRFGLDGGGVRTLKEIGEELGVTRESVRQHEFNALKKLRLHHQLVANYM
jgi:RNA polymerase sigma factor (sigma-70 family)